MVVATWSFRSLVKNAGDVRTCRKYSTQKLNGMDKILDYLGLYLNFYWSSSTLCC